MEVNFTLINKALNILEYRALDRERSYEERMTYCSALDIILYALTENEECLRQYDY